MDWFFTDTPLRKGDIYNITGEDAVHITKSLRMSVGEVITLCGNDKSEYPCIIEHISSDGVQVKVSDSYECTHEPDIKVTLFFALTKGDKPETVIQKSVELGVFAIVPIVTRRCVATISKQNIEKKIKLTKKLKTFIHRVEKKEIQDILILNYFFFVMDLEYEINELNMSHTLINYYNEKSRSYKNAYIKDNKLLIENSEIIIENIDCYNLDQNYTEQLKEGYIDLPIEEGFFSLKGKLTFRELLAKDGNIIYDSFLPSNLTKDILFKLYNIKDSIFSLENIIKLYKDNTYYFPINNKKYAAYTNKECFKVFIDYKIGNNIFSFFTFNEKIKHLIRKAIMIVNIQHEFGHSHKLLSFSFENDDYEDSPLVKIKIDILNDIEIDEAGEVFEYLLYGRSINELNMKEVIYINNLENFSKTLEEFKNDFINLKDRTLKEVLINECKNNSEITEVFKSYDQLSEEDKFALENLSFKSGKKHKTLFCDGLENVKFKIGNRKPHTKNKERLIISKFTCDCIFGEN